MNDDDLAGAYYAEPLCAFVRGRLRATHDLVDAMTPTELFALARTEKLRIFRYKRKGPLARVQRVIGMLRGLSPESIVDIGTGRGTFLWPLLDALPSLRVTCVDASAIRVRDLLATRDGGFDRIDARRDDAQQLALPSDHACGTTILEVLEHVDDPARAAAEALRVARRFVIASVPSRPDENPEHVRLFTRETLGALFGSARRVTIEEVPGHYVALAMK